MNKNIPLVSIVCTTYNQELYIKDALEGFIMQKTSFPFEIIVHDDASLDKTTSIIKEYEGKFPELFECIYQLENQFSKGDLHIWTDITFPKAKGKYIAICEGDDYWTDPFKLQKQVDFMEENKECSFCFHNANTYTVDKDVYELFNNGLRSKKYKTIDLLLKEWIVPTASIMFRKSMLPSVFPDWFSTVYSSDYALELLLSTRGEFYYFNEDMSVYRKNAINSLSANQKNPFNHLYKRIILLNNFSKPQSLFLKMVIDIVVFKIRCQIFRAKLYLSFPLIVSLKAWVGGIVKK